jgi:hypothetical protein
VVGEERDGRVRRDVGQAAQAHRRLRLDVVDRRVDGVAVDGEDDRDEVRAAVGAGRRQPRDTGGGEAGAGFARVHAPKLSPGLSAAGPCSTPKRFPECGRRQSR